MLYLRNISSIILCILFFIWVSCSKSANTNPPPPVVPNIFTYTVTDTLGNEFTFSDTSIAYIADSPANAHWVDYEVNGVKYDQINWSFAQYPAAFIVQPFSQYNQYNTMLFSFEDYRSVGTQGNHISFRLHSYQDSISIDSVIINDPRAINPPPIPFDLVFNGCDYSNTSTYITSNTVGLDSIHLSINVTDTAKELATGSFNISAKTVTNKPILVKGSFSHVIDHFFYR